MVMIAKDLISDDSREFKRAYDYIIRHVNLDLLTSMVKKNLGLDQKYNSPELDSSVSDESMSSSSASSSSASSSSAQQPPFEIGSREELIEIVEYLDEIITSNQDEIITSNQKNSLIEPSQRLQRLQKVIHDNLRDPTNTINYTKILTYYDVLIGIVFRTLGDNAMLPIKRINDNLHYKGPDEQQQKTQHALLGELINEFFKIKNDVTAMLDGQNIKKKIDFTAVWDLLKYQMNKEINFGDDNFGERYFYKIANKWWKKLPISEGHDEASTSKKKTSDEIVNSMEMIDIIFFSWLNENMKIFSDAISSKKENRTSTIREIIKNKYVEMVQKSFEDAEFKFIGEVEIFGRKTHNPISHQFNIFKKWAIYINNFELGDGNNFTDKQRKTAANVLIYLRLINDELNIRWDKNDASHSRLKPESFGGIFNSIDRMIECIDTIDHCKNVNSRASNARTTIVTCINEKLKTNHSSKDDAMDRRLLFHDRVVELLREFDGLDAGHDFAQKTLWDQIDSLYNQEVFNQTHIKMRLNELCRQTALYAGLSISNYDHELIAKRQAIIDILKARGANGNNDCFFEESGNPLHDDKILEFFNKLDSDEKILFENELDDPGKEELKSVILKTRKLNKQHLSIPSILLDSFDGCAPKLQNYEKTDYTFKNVFGDFNYQVISNLDKGYKSHLADACSNNVGHLVIIRHSETNELLAMFGVEGPITVNNIVATLKLINVEASECLRGEATASNIFKGTVAEFIDKYGIELPPDVGGYDQTRFNQVLGRCMYFNKTLSPDKYALLIMGMKTIGDKVMNQRTEDNTGSSPIKCVFTIDGNVKYMMWMNYILGINSDLASCYQSVGKNFYRSVGTYGEDTATKSLRLVDNIMNCMTVGEDANFKPEYDKFVQKVCGLSVPPNDDFIKNDNVTIMLEEMINFISIPDDRVLSKNPATRIFDSCSLFLIKKEIPDVIKKINGVKTKCLELIEEINKRETDDVGVIKLLKQMTQLPNVERLCKPSTVNEYGLNQNDLDIREDLFGKRIIPICSMKITGVNNKNISFMLKRVSTKDNGVNFMDALLEQGHDAVNHLCVSNTIIESPRVSSPSMFGQRSDLGALSCSASRSASPLTFGKSSPRAASRTASPLTIGKNSALEALSHSSSPTIFGQSSPSAASRAESPIIFGQSSPRSASRAESPTIFGQSSPIEASFRAEPTMERRIVTYEYSIGFLIEVLYSIYAYGDLFSVENDNIIDNLLLIILTYFITKYDELLIDDADADVDKEFFGLLMQIVELTKYKGETIRSLQSLRELLGYLAKQVVSDSDCPTNSECDEKGFKRPLPPPPPKRGGNEKRMTIRKRRMTKKRRTTRKRQRHITRKRIRKNNRMTKKKRRTRKRKGRR